VKHLICLTVDTDPDGLSGKITNRQALGWEGFENLRSLPDKLAAVPSLGRVPITWFVRADGQLESILGSAAYLLEVYGDFWARASADGDEMGWHPHLYLQARPSDATLLITDPRQAQDEIERLWSILKGSVSLTAFRNGEGWHLPGTYTTVERLGFRCDSTAIPGRVGSSGHPMNWTGAPNQPYFPAWDDLCKPDRERALLELPMNTWHLQASHDSTPKVRYMNPAVHPHLFASALKNWENACMVLPADLYVWVMIFHPDEVLATQGDDALYSRSASALCTNLIAVSQSLGRLGQEFEWVTISNAADRWRGHRRRRSA
jgi:hypothetical protein